MEFTDTETPISPDELAQFEADHQLHLPSDYKTHVLEHNGGVCSHDHFITEDDELFVASFFSIKHGENSVNRLFSWFDQLPQRPLAMHLFPFADDGFGNFYCLNLEQAGVELFAHDADTGTEKLADGFTEFLQQLHEEPEDYMF